MWNCLLVEHFSKFACVHCSSTNNKTLRKKLIRNLGRVSKRFTPFVVEILGVEEDSTARNNICLMLRVVLEVFESDTRSCLVIYWLA